MSQIQQGAAVDLMSPEFVANRHTVYRELRQSRPVVALPGPAPTRLLTRHDDISAVLTDRDVVMKAPGSGAPPWLGDGAAAAMHTGQMLFTDPPDHNRLRKVTTPAFRPKSVDVLHRAVQAAVDTQIEVMGEKGEVDLVADFAEIVPAVAVCTILGVPMEDWEPLIRRAVDFVLVLSPMPLSEVELVRAENACAFYLDYFSDLIEDRRASPRGDDDFVTVLVKAEAEGRMSTDELLVTAHSVLNAGFETTMSGLANGLQAMLTQATPWALLTEDPARSLTAVEETLRWEAPAQILSRFVVDDLPLPCGETLPAGTTVLLAIASGNRDEQVFANPDTFDLTREEIPHLSFSLGRHACIGAHLGRMEMDIALRQLAQAFPDLRLVEDDAPRELNPMFPTLTRLTAEVGRA